MVAIIFFTECINPFLKTERVDDTLSDNCVDISTFTPVQFNYETFQFCTTDLINVCEVRIIGYFNIRFVLKMIINAY